MSNYPDKIFTRPSNEEMLWHSDQLKAWEVADMVRNAYDICKREHAKQEATTETEWYNLTQAIAGGEPVDWEKLDGRKAWLKHEDGDVYGNLRLNNRKKPASDISWYLNIPHCGELVSMAWDGSNGWTLWIDRPVPLKPKTADQLEPGTCIRTTGGVLGMVYEDASGIKGFWGANQTVKLADEVEVQNEYGIGTFKVVENEA